MTCVFKKLETDIVIDFNWSEAKSKWFQRKKRKMIEEERKWAASEPHEPLPLWLAELPQVKLTAIDRPGRLRPLFTFNQPLPLITPQAGGGDSIAKLLMNSTIGLPRDLDVGCAESNHRASLTKCANSLNKIAQRGRLLVT